VFDALKRAGSELSVLHHIRFAAGTHRDEIVIKTGVGLLLLLLLLRLVLLLVLLVHAQQGAWFS
jgi:hypothetical protein